MLAGELNSLLSVSPFVDISLGVPRLFGLDEGSEAGVPIDGLSQLVSGLLARYGENDLAAAINKVRVEHLESTSDVVFAETEFQVEPQQTAAFHSTRTLTGHRLRARLRVLARL